MCLITFAVDVHPEYRLLLAANRDERYSRATAPVAEWQDPAGIIGGRDLEGGGTWLGVTRKGRFAAVTNYHERIPPPSDAPTRGALVTDYLSSAASATEHARRLTTIAHRFAGFNLILGDEREVVWFSNRSDQGPVVLKAGVYGLSNHLLDTPWPKVEYAKDALSRSISRERTRPGDLLDMMNSREVREEAGNPAALSPFERALSAAFIVTQEYGTRTSSALILRHGGGGVLAERSHDHGSADFTERMVEL